MKSWRKTQIFLEESYDQVNLVEQETGNAILEDKKFDFPKEYYQIHHLPQTTEQIENDKQETI